MKCELWSVKKYELWSMNYELWSMMKCEVWTMKSLVSLSLYIYLTILENLELWSVNCEVWNVKCEVWIVNYEVTSLS